MSDPYSRFYWRFIDEYPELYADAKALGTWMQLLVSAEMAHPTAPLLPRKLRSSVLKLLIDAELVVLLPGDRYRVRGLEAERQRRSDAGRKGGLASARSRTGSTDVERTSNERSTGVEPRRDEQRRDEQRRDETRSLRPLTGLTLPVKTMDGSTAKVSLDPNAEPTDVHRLQEVAEKLTGQAYVMANVHGGLGRKAVEEQLKPHGYDRVTKAWATIAKQVHAAGGPGIRPTLRQLVLGADDILNPIMRPDAKEQREDETKAAFERRVARTQAEIAGYRGDA